MKPKKYQKCEVIDLTSTSKEVMMKGRRYRLPEVLFFDDGKETLRFNARFYKVVDFRRPKKGEWFLSGSVIEAYLAGNDFLTPYLIVIPTHKVILNTLKFYSLGDEV